MPIQPFKPRKEQPEIQAKEYPPSQTEQNSAMSIADIFGRYNTSLPEKAHPFFDVEDLNDISKLHSQNIDLVDLEDLQRKTAKMVTTIEEKIASSREQEKNSEPETNDPAPAGNTSTNDNPDTE